jgi:hypothetical protein
LGLDENAEIEKHLCAGPPIFDPPLPVSTSLPDGALRTTIGHRPRAVILKPAFWAKDLQFVRRFSIAIADCRLAIGDALMVHHHRSR